MHFFTIFVSALVEDLLAAATLFFGVFVFLFSCMVGIPSIVCGFLLLSEDTDAEKGVRTLKGKS